MGFEEAKYTVARKIYDYSMSNKKPIKSHVMWLIKAFVLVTAIIVALLLAGYVLKAKPAHAEATFGDNPAKGFFFYDDPSPAKKKDKKEETTMKGEPKTDKEEFDFPVIAEAPPVLRKFLKDPTDANAKEWLAWQYKYMQHLKKIGYYTRSAGLKYGGEVYPIQEAPDSILSSVYYPDLYSRTLTAIFGQVRDKVGLVYFYQKNCGVCSQQKDIMNMFVSKHQLSIRGVNVDGDGDIDEGLNFSSVTNPLKAVEYGITQTPTLVAVYEKDGDVRVGGIAVGIAPINVIEQQLLKFLQVEGIIKERDINVLKNYFNK